jgi:hypothetical protein
MKTTREQSRFDAALRQVLSVSKEELLRREKQYQDERAGKPKRGPKPRPSALGHASGDKD